MDRGAAAGARAALDRDRAERRRARRCGRVAPRGCAAGARTRCARRRRRLAVAHRAGSSRRHRARSDLARVGGVALAGRDDRLVATWVDRVDHRARDRAARVRRPCAAGSRARGGRAASPSPATTARTGVIVALDVDYRADAVVTGCVGFAAWTDPAPARELVVRSAVPPAAYEPGRFYERELPYLRGALAEIAAELVVIDGHVWLAANAPG